MLVLTVARPCLNELCKYKNNAVFAGIGGI